LSGSVSSPGDLYDATGTLRVAGANVPGGSSGDVLTSDAFGNLSLQAPQASADSPAAVALQRAFTV
jgi:hypothetical protein